MTQPTLQAWIDEHGPLGSHEAAFVALACVSRLLHARTARRRWAVQHLDAAHVTRAADGAWDWNPGVDADGRHVTERDAVMAVGQLLGAILVGDPWSGPARRPESLRRHRPDLPLAFDALVTRANRGDVSLAALAAGLQVHLGTRPHGWRVPLSLRWTGGLLATAAVVLAITGSLASPRTNDAGHVSAAAWESIYGYTWADEQTSAADVVNEELRRVVDAVGPNRACVWWLDVWNAWLRQQLGDALTAEQLAPTNARSLAQGLSLAHPRAQAAAVLHASVLQGRGAHREAVEIIRPLIAAHAATMGVRMATETWPANNLGARLDRDGDGDGLADLLERHLGTPPDTRAVPGELLQGLPVRSLAIPFGPPFGIGHLPGVLPDDEGFVARAAAGRAWTHILPSVPRGFAERYGWVLVVDRPREGCRIELDTGIVPRRLAIDGGRPPGAPASPAAPSAAPSRLVADFDERTRRISWWTSAGATWETAFDVLPDSGSGPYGLHLTSPSGLDACGAVTWILRGSAIAPM